ncbi:outer membrane protein assembly factor BamD, partial [Singulisphaera rosea]
EFRAAEKLYKQGKLVEAEAAFGPIIRKRKGTPWGEKAQFLTAECQFQRGKLVAANDSYELLLRDYPGTEYRDRLVAREYANAERWLALDDPKAKAEQKPPWYSRFDGRRPLVDTQGNAIAALEHVRQHDPIGPLADDAVLRIADIHMGNGEFELAAMHYDQLSSDHAKSPFAQKAQLASIDARMKAYIGPEYDGGGLEKAREMIKQTMVSFPDHPENNEKLYHTLDIINDAEAERTYMIADYYKRTGKVISAEYEFGKVRHRWPKSTWAVKAKAELATLAKMPRKEIQPSKIMGMPNTDPNSMQGAMGGGGGMGGMGMGGRGGMGGMN